MRLTVLVLLVVLCPCVHADWMVKQVAAIPGGLSGYGQCVCADADHNGCPELTSWRGLGSNIWTWQTWECRQHDHYVLVKAESCFGHPYPPTGMWKGEFIPTDEEDFDGDGLMDVLGVNEFYHYDSAGRLAWDNYLCLYESRNPQSLPDSLVWKYQYGSNNAVYPLAWFPGDMDCDGHREILFADGFRTRIFENRGNDSNDLVWTSPLHYYGFAYAWGDFDGDGRTEFVAQRPSLAPFYVLVWKCTGDDQYQLVDSLAAPYDNGFDMWASHDLNHTGKQEFFVGFVTGYSGWWQYNLCMYGADGNGHYVCTPIDSTYYTGVSDACHSCCADIDGDGSEEIVWSYNSGVRIYKCIGGNQFQCVWTWDNPIAPCEANVHCHDMNGNGYPDIVISGSGRTVVYEMEAIRVLYPNGGQTFASGDTCRIRWRTFNPPRCDSISLFLRTDTIWSLADTIAHGIAPGESSCLWTVPDVKSKSCKVVAVAYGPGWQYGESDSCFSIASSGVTGTPVSRTTSTRLIGVEPNPTGGHIRVTYDLRERGRVQVKLVDVSGRIVRILEDDAVNSGSHELDWNAGGLAPGLYFLSFDADRQREIRKVTIAR